MEGGDARVKARRPHHKSRNGCVQCKQRKVKCGEEKPKCKKCESYGTVCSFLQTHPLRATLASNNPPTIESTGSTPTLSHVRPLTIESMLSPEPVITSRPSTVVASSPVRQLTPLPAVFTMQDLELIHYWTTTCAEGFFDGPDMVHVYRTLMVQVAFEYPFLMHEVLALSALTMALSRPHQKATYMHVSDTHAATALSLFQPAISSLTEENCHACFAFSSLIWGHAWASQDLNKSSTLFFNPPFEDEANGHNIRWVKLHRGTSSIIGKMYPILLRGPFATVFNVWKDLDEDRDDPVLEEEEIQFRNLAEAWSSSHTLSDESKVVLDGALKSLRRVYSMYTYTPEINNLAIVMSWFSTVSDEYLEMLERKVPQAVLVAMYYCVVVKRLEKIWWLRGKAENLLQTLLNVLGYNDWNRWTQWPVDQVFHRVK